MKIIKFNLIFFILFIIPKLLNAQTIQTPSVVTATVVDSDGTAWVNGTVSAVFYNPKNNIPLDLTTSLPFPTQASTINLDNTGTFTLTLQDNSQTAPAGTQWIFTVCPNASVQCSIIQTAISGATENLSTIINSQIKPPRFPATGFNSYGYGDFEISVTPTTGNTYYNVTTGYTRQWNGHAWVNLVAGSGVPGGTATALLGPVQFNNMGYFGGDFTLVKRFFDGSYQTSGRDIISKGPRINILDTDFATGPLINCIGVDGNPNGYYDATGVYNSECALKNAFYYAGTLSNAGGTPIIYVPPSNGWVSVSGYSFITTINQNISLEGDGSNVSVITNRSPNATFLTQIKATDIHIRDIGINGYTTSGTPGTGGGIEWLGVTESSIAFSTFDLMGGNALNFQGGTEGNTIDHVKTDNDRRCILAQGNTNEDYFINGNCRFGGQVNGYFYGVNWNNGVQITTSPIPEPYPVIWLGGVNVNLTNYSVKEDRMIGVHAAQTGEISHIYCEKSYGTAYSTATSCIELTGKLIITHGTSTLSNTGTSSAGDASVSWQPTYVNDPANITQPGGSVSLVAYIFPIDYTPGSTTASVVGGGITQCQYEQVNAVAAGDGNIYYLTRGTNGHTAPGGTTCGIINTGYTWTANNYVVEWDTDNSTLKLVSDHLNSVNNGTGPAAQCSDTALQTNWIASPSLICGDILVGPVFDGYEFPYLTASTGRNYGGTGYLTIDNIDVFENNAGETVGNYWVKIPAQGNVVVQMGNIIPSVPYNTATIYNTYTNNLTQIQILTYPGCYAGGTCSAQGRIYDTDTNFYLENNNSTQFNTTFRGDVALGYNSTSIWTQYGGSAQQHCSFTTAPSSSTYASATCINNNGVPTGQIWNSATSHFVTAPGTSNLVRRPMANTITAITLNPEPTATPQPPTTSGFLGLPNHLSTTVVGCTASGQNTISTAEYSAGIVTSNYTNIRASFTPALPPGVAYGVGYLNVNGTDPITNTTGPDIYVALCNTTTSSIALPATTYEIQQMQ